MNSANLISKNYEESSGLFSAHQSTECYWRAWIADSSFRCNLIIHHGLGEHSGRYGNILSSFAGEKVNIFAYDARGHGKSKGKRGAARSIQELVFDLDLFLAMLGKDFGVKKFILYGHSMGSLVAFNFALSHSKQQRLQALILSGVPIRPILNFPQRMKLAVGRRLHSFFPDMILPSSLPSKALSHDPELVQSYLHDPLVHNRVSLNLAMELVEGGNDILKKAKNLYIPSLFVHGEADPIVSSSGSKELYENISSKDKELIIYPDLYHEIHNELLMKRKQALEDLKAWTLAHIALTE